MTPLATGLQGCELDVSEKALGPFGLEQDAPPRGLRSSSLVYELGVDEKLHTVAVGDDLQKIPLAMGLFYLPDGIPVSEHRLPGTLTEPRETI